ncbi:MAG: PAS domain-containing sensor histidine kinase, partial [Candidatus Heimdallarchaeota archaeon]|nr:PAS domain-containing sensor histidine kinase [Candidatus Heimdallarchaeota archaeon]
MTESPESLALKTALDMLPSAVFITRHSWDMVFANKAFYEISGYSTSDMETKHIMDLVHEEDKHIFYERRKILEEGGKVPAELQIRITHTDGSVSLVFLKINDITFDGKPARLWYAHNISSEALMHQPPELVRSLLDAISIGSELGFWVDDIKGNTIYINDKMCEVLGYPFEEIKTKSITDFFHPASRDLYHQISRDRVEGINGSSSYELILINRDGRPITFSVVGSLLHDQNQNVIGSVGFFSNIEPTKKLSLIVSTLNKYALYSRYRDLSLFWQRVLVDVVDIFSADCGLVFIDGDVVAENGEINEDFSPQEMLEELTKEGSLVKHYHESSSQFSKEYKSAIVTVLHLNNLPAGFMIICSKVKNLFLPGDVDLYLTFANQITLNYEHQFLFMESELERQFVSILLDILSHDFLNTNTSVQGYLELLDQNFENMDTEKIKDYLTRSINVVDKGERILETIQQLLKIQQERKSKGSVPAIAMLENAIETQRNLFQDRIVEIETKTPQSIPVIGGDLLQTVFENIINNAIKHNKSEEVIIEISCQLLEIDNQEFFECRIVDNGSGIPEEIRDTFFRPLSRGDSRFHEGTGLGLYI